MVDRKLRPIGLYCSTLAVRRIIGGFESLFVVEKSRWLFARANGCAWISKPAEATRRAMSCRLAGPCVVTISNYSACQNPVSKDIDFH